jgi:hypothetical protein
VACQRGDAILDMGHVSDGLVAYFYLFFLSYLCGIAFVLRIYIIETFFFGWFFPEWLQD